MLNCPECGAPAEDGDNFCGECRTPLAGVTPRQPKSTPKAYNPSSCACGANPVKTDADGFCLECGRQVSTDPHNHAELEHGPDFAAVTDRGRKHHQNEDAILVAEITNDAAPIRLLAVSDGVSTSYQPDKASGLAVEKLRDATIAALRANPAMAMAALETGFTAAQNAVSAIPSPSTDLAPAATLVAALTQNNTATIGWMGDSRAYLFSDRAVQLTHDDSWINMVVDRGEMSFEEASKNRYAHAITSCLGRDDNNAANPHFITVELPPGSILLLCSDGLWNYAETAPELNDLIARQPPGSTAVAIARNLVAFANASGGKDNISAAILRTKEVN